MHYGTSLPENLRISAIVDVANSIQYLHDNDFVHGDITPLNILVCGDAEDDFIFKITDYSCVGSKMNAHVRFSSNEFR